MKEKSEGKIKEKIRDKSRQAFAHYAHSGRVLACGVARVLLYTLNSLFQDSALTAGSTRKVKNAGERWGDSPTNPPKSGQQTKHRHYLTPQESPPHSQVRAGGRKNKQAVLTEPTQICITMQRTHHK